MNVHHPKAQFDENVCVIGAACFVYCASHWLENHRKKLVKLQNITSKYNVNNI